MSDHKFKADKDVYHATFLRHVVALVSQRSPEHCMSNV
jgi:hypothetical protein